MSDPYPSIRVQPSVDLSKKPSTKQLDGSDKESATSSRDARDDNMRDSNNHTQSLTQINQLSNTVLLFALAVFVLSIAMAAYAIGIANQAEREAQNAEREARVAMNHADLLDVDTKQNAAVIEKLIVKQSVKEALLEK